MEGLGNEVINAFITLTENIANSRTNVLDFGSEDMIFYRGEIHIIKMIGDYPGIFSSEIARRFGITRAVVHKTLLKLEEREFVIKEQDDEDRKRHKLFLTEKGQLAYEYHEKYHNLHDKALFDYVEGLPSDQLEAIKGFLEHANNLIQNHA
ncbi:MarR family transcriptional regulator [Tissierella pigra]|uniref:MarR family transcriptional regulator n=1 Tax=Tissierella pigra TaxID=2607614 RepID=A0A6N7XZP9_9FIRM|nr:MarR family transcriptional regulator [Tissierella pigra]MBU5425082.1 MarR family transcriptional regulator [Tissierella pigra]MBU5425092.1 MarR family transcriptional regulator [Tissierella pigra]MSU01698.1 MarR family transcriptional regulator [Tissierella pigra]MSU01708.1 MarR family transcriptional regulator [Tissierella pigra]